MEHPAEASKGLAEASKEALCLAAAGGFVAEGWSLQAGRSCPETLDDQEAFAVDIVPLAVQGD